MTCLVLFRHADLFHVRVSNAGIGFYESSSQNWLQASSQCVTQTLLFALELYCDGLLFDAHSGVVAAAAHSLLTETDMGTCPRSFLPSKLLFPKHKTQALLLWLKRFAIIFFGYYYVKKQNKKPQISIHVYIYILWTEMGYLFLLLSSFMLS